MTLHLPDLTPAQRRVAELKGRGLSATVIAQQLSISVNTVRVHLTAIASRIENPERLTRSELVTQWAARQMMVTSHI